MRLSLPRPAHIRLTWIRVADCDEASYYVVRFMWQGTRSTVCKELRSSISQLFEELDSASDLGL